MADKKSSTDQDPPVALAREVGSCPFPQPVTKLSEWEHLTLHGGTELDRVLRWVSKKLGSISLTHAAVEETLRDFNEARAHYRALESCSEIAAYYPKPKHTPHVCMSKPHQLVRGDVVDVTIETDFCPPYVAFRKEFFSRDSNRIASVRHWRHPNDEHLGTVVAIHGWNMGHPRLNSVTLLPGLFYRMGLNVVVYELPYHGNRVIEQKGKKKIVFPSAHIARTNEAFVQAVYELRSLVKWLNSDKPVGVMGFSLGAYTAALWSSLDSLDFVIPIAPIASLADVAFEVVSDAKKRPKRKDWNLLEDITLAELRMLYRMHSPLSLHSAVPPHRQFIVAGANDMIVPPWQVEMLRDHWRRPAIHWYSGGHLDFQKSIETDVHHFLQGLGLAFPTLLRLDNVRPELSPAMLVEPEIEVA